jgi:hypothetical protein
MKPKRVRVNYRLPVTTVKWVKQFAKKGNTTSTAIVQRAIAVFKEVKDGQAPVSR